MEWVDVNREMEKSAELLRSASQNPDRERGIDCVWCTTSPEGRMNRENTLIYKGFCTLAGAQFPRVDTIYDLFVPITNR